MKLREVFPSIVVVGAITQLHVAEVVTIGQGKSFFYIVLLIIAALVGSRSVFHFLSLMLVWMTLHYFLPSPVVSISAVYLFVVFIVSSAPFIRTRELRAEYFKWFSKGHINRTFVLLALSTAVVSGIALILWANWTNQLGVGEKTVVGLAEIPKMLVIAGIVPAFSLLNAFSEEVVFRGIIQESLHKVFKSEMVANLMQASAFAIIHFAAGFPNGVVGYAMTFVYGFMLGYLRIRTRGILLPYLTHIVADLVIIYYLVGTFL